MTPGERLQRSHWDTFWVPPDVRVVDRPELLYTSCPRPRPYLNEVLRTAAPAARLPALVAEVVAAHGDGPTRWDVYDGGHGGAQAPLERALSAAGFAPGHRHEARVIRVEAFEPRTRGDIAVSSVADEADMRASLEVGDRAFGMAFPRTDDEIARDLAQCTGPGARVYRALARDTGGAPIATGGMGLWPALGFALLFGGSTVPEARGRGAYAAVLADRLAHARRLGVTWAGLYARETSSAPIVARMGFERCGVMRFWNRPPA